MPSLAYRAWNPLTPGAIIDIIAPAGRCTPECLVHIKNLLQGWQLNARIPNELLGKDLLCANTDEHRFAHLQDALFNSESSAIWCVRGGYGCTRLIPRLLQLNKAPSINKLFIGFSDITTLHLFIQQRWHYQTLHGPSASHAVNAHIDRASIQEFKKIIFGELTQVVFTTLPLNTQHALLKSIRAPIIGGTLTLVQNSLGTDWQIETQDKILFLEEVNESAYRIDRMLQHLRQAGILQTVKAILFGDFIPTVHNNDIMLIQSVLKRFANELPIPVLQIYDVGHGKKNRCLPLGAHSELNFDSKQLTITIG